MYLPISTREEVPPSSADRDAVYVLATAGETARSGAPGSPQASGALLLGLALGLSANPRRSEPIEDAFGGMLQSLVCEQVF